MKHNNSGYSAAHVLLVIVLIGIIGFTGWYVWHANNTVDSNLAASNASNQVVKPTAKSKQSTTTTAVNETDNWYKYSAPNNVYSLKLADGLTFTKEDRGNSFYTIYTEDVTAAKAGMRAKVVTSDPNNGRDGVKGMFVSYFKNAEASTNSGTKQTGFTTDSGLKVEKSYYMQATEPDGIGLDKGDKQYNYSVLKNGSSLEISYVIPAGQTGNLELVEKMVRTANL